MGWNTRKGDQPNDGWWRAWFDHVPSPGLDQDLGPSALKNASAAASIASTAGDVVQDSLAALNWLYVKWFPLRFPSWEINNIHIYIYGQVTWLECDSPFQCQLRAAQNCRTVWSEFKSNSERSIPRPCPQLYNLIRKVYQIPTRQLDLSPLMHTFITKDQMFPNCWSMGQHEQPANNTIPVFPRISKSVLHTVVAQYYY